MKGGILKESGEKKQVSTEFIRHILKNAGTKHFYFNELESKIIKKTV